MAGFEIPEVEQVGQEVLDALRKENAAFLDAQYYGQVAEFRASVVQRLLGLNAVHGGVGWAMYREQARQQSNVLVDGQGKETLLVMFGSNKTGQSAPHIRVVTNTEFRFTDQIAVFTEDATIDAEGDTQLFIDAIFIDDTGAVLPSREPHIQSFSPLFFIQDGEELKTINMENFTPIHGIGCFINNGAFLLDTAVRPFGLYTNYEDKIAALEWAQDILQATEQAELIAHSTALEA